MIGQWAFTDEIATGRCAVVTHNKERTLCANIGASAKYPTSAFEENKAAFMKASIIYSTGFFITSNDECLRKVCDLATEMNKPMAFNIAAVFLMFIAKESVDYCIEHADFVFCNEDEGSQYAEMAGLDKSDRVGCAKLIAKSKKSNQMRPRVVIITQGPDSVIVAEHDPKQPESEPWVCKVDIPKLDKEKIVDTNGCGDAFVGAFLAAQVRGKHIIDCVKDGISMSACVV